MADPTAGGAPGPERTPGGNDLALLRESLELTPEQRIARNTRWLRTAVSLRAGLDESRDGAPPDPPGPR